MYTLIFSFINGLNGAPLISPEVAKQCLNKNARLWAGARHWLGQGVYKGHKEDCIIVQVDNESALQAENTILDLCDWTGQESILRVYGGPAYAHGVLGFFAQFVNVTTRELEPGNFTLVPGDDSGDHTFVEGGWHGHKCWKLGRDQAVFS